MRALIALLALLLCSFQQPSVGVIVLDDLGWSEYPMLTSLDALAAEGVTFTRAYSFPVCTTTRLAMSGGLYPRRDGVGSVELVSDSGARTVPLSRLWMPELFKAHGFATGLIGKWHLGRAPLLDEMDSVTSGPYCQGWDVWRAAMPSAPATFGGANYYDWQRVDDGDAHPETYYAPWAQRDAFLDWWASTPGQKLGWLGFIAAHSPYDPPPGYRLQSTARANYEQVVLSLNGTLGTIFAALDLQTTYVVVVADNGTPEDARPAGALPGTHKGTTYQGGVRVPLVIAGPGISAGITTTRIVSVLDLVPTLAEVVGIEPPANSFTDGVSFADALGAPWTGAPARSWAFTEIYLDGYDDQAVIEASWKLRRVTSNGTSGSPSMPTTDLFYKIKAGGGEVLCTPPAADQARLLGELNSIPPRAP